MQQQQPQQLQQQQQTVVASSSLNIIKCTPNLYSSTAAQIGGVVGGTSMMLTTPQLTTSSIVPVSSSPQCLRPSGSTNLPQQQIQIIKTTPTTASNVILQPVTRTVATAGPVQQQQQQVPQQQQRVHQQLQQSRINQNIVRQLAAPARTSTNNAPIAAPSIQTYGKPQIRVLSPQTRSWSPVNTLNISTPAASVSTTTISATNVTAKTHNSSKANFISQQQKKNTISNQSAQVVYQHTKQDQIVQQSKQQQHQQQMQQQPMISSIRLLPSSSLSASSSETLLRESDSSIASLEPPLKILRPNELPLSGLSVAFASSPAGATTISPDTDMSSSPHPIVKQHQLRQQQQQSTPESFVVDLAQATNGSNIVETVATTTSDSTMVEKVGASGCLSSTSIALSSSAGSSSSVLLTTSPSDVLKIAAENVHEGETTVDLAEEAIHQNVDGVADADIFSQGFKDFFFFRLDRESN